MKTLVSIVLLVLFCASVSYSQPDTTHRARRADNVTTFFVGSFGPFSNWDFSDSANHFAPMSSPLGHRYTNIEDSLGMNGEDRGFWDFPDTTHPNHGRPAPKDTVLGGKRGQFLGELIIEPLQLFTAFENAQYMKFEFERHTLEADTFEYPGFLAHSGLTGTNQKITGATYPPYLAETPRSGDTSVNALQLNTSSDAAGVFADSLWFPGYLGSILDLDDSSRGYFKKNYNKELSRKMLLRLRVKINQTITGTPILCIVTRTEKAIDGTTLVTQIDTIRVDTNFTHIDSDFDNVDIRFIRDKSYNLTNISNDRTDHM